MRITRVDDKPLHRLRYLNAGKRGGTESSALDITLAQVEGMPESLDAIVCASDLQGVVPTPHLEHATTLLGIALADELIALAEEGKLPYPQRTGVLLAGDLYSSPGGNVRGASGDVREVWNAFSDEFAWVAGVQGNHDVYGSTEADKRRFTRNASISLLEDEVVERNEMKLGGVGLIIGDVRKQGRRHRDDFLAAVGLVRDARPDILVMHQGPRGDEGQRGDIEINDTLARFDGLVVCGHSHWDKPLAPLGSKAQVLNVDARCVVLRRKT